MVRKKRGKKVVRKATKRVKHRVPKLNVKSRLSLVVNNLLLFIALSLVSLVLYRYIQNEFLINLFFAMAVIFGFIAVGFLIAFIILMIMKVVVKK